MLIQTCVSYAREILPSCNVMTTVSPYNEYSLRNVQAEGFTVRKRLMKYGGHERFILESIPDAEREYPEFMPSDKAVILPVENILQNPESPQAASPSLLRWC